MANDCEAEPTTRFKSEDTSVTTRYVPVPRFTRWTFEIPAIKKWAEDHLSGRVLNACSGKCQLSHNNEVVRNDVNSDRDADLHVDAAELSAYFDAESFDTIVFDPPWTLYQANLRYEGHHVHTTGDNWENEIDLSKLPVQIAGGREKEQLGHARLAKEGFSYLLKPGGKVLELTFHGTCMPSRLGFNRQERVVFDPIGEGKAVIGSVDRKTQTRLDVEVGYVAE